MTTLTEIREDDLARGVGKAWWLFLLAGIAWVIIALVILTVDPSSVTTIGYLTGFVLLLAGVTELVVTAVGPGWRWLHGLLGALFLAGGLAAVLDPFQTFGILAVLIGWYLVISGTVAIVESLAGRDVIPLWGLVLGLGVVEVAIGIWAIGSFARSAWLLILWVGIAALTRGIAEIVMAFRVRHLAEELA